MHPSGSPQRSHTDLGIHLIRVAQLLPGEACKGTAFSIFFKYLRCQQAFFPVESNMFHHCFCGQATLLPTDPKPGKNGGKALK